MFKFILFILFLDMLYLFNKYCVLKINYYFNNLSSDSEDNVLEMSSQENVQEEYEDVSINEFDERIKSLKNELLQTRREENETEIITESYEKEIYG